MPQTPPTPKTLTCISSRLAPYALAILFVAAGLAIRLLMRVTLGSHGPFLIVFPTVLLATWYGGFGPGLLAVILSGTLTATYFVQDSPVAEPFTIAQRVALFIIYVTVGGLVAWFLNQFREQNRRRAQEALGKQQQAEELATVSEARFRRAIEQAPFPIALYADDGIILNLNRAWTDSTGYTLDQLPTLADWIERTCSDKQLAQAEADRALAANQATIDHGEIVLLTADGQELVWDFTSGLLDRLPDGRRLGIAMAKDVTRRKRVEELVWLKTAVEAAVNGIVIVDPAGVILWANPAFSRMTGYAVTELIGQHTRLLKSGVQDDGFYENLWTTVTAGQVWRGVLCNRRKDGSQYTEEMTITPIRDKKGTVTAFVALKEDITDKQRLQSQLQQSQKLEAIGQLAGGVAHDFNNLLTVISGYSEMLLATLPPQDAKRDFVRAINDAAERAAGLTRQLLAFSRKSILEPKVLDPNDLVRETEKMLRRLIGDDVMLASVLAPDVHRVKIDAGQMSQVLMNLAVNARDAMPTGGKLTIETKNVDLDESHAGGHQPLKPGRYVLIAVSDTGSGMTPEVKARLFEPFFTTKGMGRGTGLGLAVVQGIVRQSGGQIEVYSELGLGTTFKIYLPAAPEDEKIPAVPEPSHSNLRGPEVVCLVEDDDNVRNLARLAVQDKGYVVLHACSAKDALNVLERHPGPIDMLVTDVVMPGISGRELADIFKSKFSTIKILYTSGYTDDTVVRHGILEAEVAFLQKPYTPASLIKKVRQVLDQKAPDR